MKNFNLEQLLNGKNNNNDINCDWVTLHNEEEVKIKYWTRSSKVSDYTIYASIDKASCGSYIFCFFSDDSFFEVREADILTFFRVNTFCEIVVYDYMKFQRFFEERGFDKSVQHSILEKVIDLKHERDLLYIALGKDIARKSVIDLMKMCSIPNRLFKLSRSKKESQLFTMEECHYLKKLEPIISRKLDKIRIDGEFECSWNHQLIHTKAEIALNSITEKGIAVNIEEVYSQFAIVRSMLDSCWDRLKKYKITRTNHHISLIADYLKRYKPTGTLNNEDKRKVSTLVLKSMIDDPSLSKKVKEVFTDLSTIFELKPYESLFKSLLNVERTYPPYRTLNSTGRASSFKSDIGVHIQGIYKKFPSMAPMLNCRRLFIPDKNHVFLQVDYKMIELCALAQICKTRFGKSALADKINEGIDIHAFVASKILKKKVPEVSDSERSLMKAVNYGLPGGMGIETLHKTLLEIDRSLNEDDVKKISEAWFDLFPEVREYMKPSRSLYEYYNLGQLNEPFVSRSNNQFKFLAVCGGTELTVNKYREDCFKLLEKYCSEYPSELRMAISNRVGSNKLLKEVKKVYAESTLTGRIKSKMSYPQRANYGFQGLIADGMKIALFNLWAEDIVPNAFITDEVLISVSLTDLRLQERIKTILIDSMREVIPDISISVDAKILRNWCEGSEIK